jgi:putative permease
MLAETAKPVKRDQHLKRDLVKLGWVLCVIAAGIGIFMVNPALSSPTMISIVLTTLLSPLVTSLERQGLPRAASILLIYLAFGAIIGMSGVWGSKSLVEEWGTLQEKTPQYFHATVDKIRRLEADSKEKYSFLASYGVTDSLLGWGRQSGQWTITNVPAIMGSLLSWMFLVPILTFFMLNDGLSLKKRFFSMVPNRFFEPAFMMTSQIVNSLSDYIRAKLVEAFLVGLMTGVGLYIIGAPYALVLGIVAGVTNILPYIGPVLGAVPALIVVWFDPATAHLIAPVLLVYVVANVIDMVFIFPVLVAKLVDLHPLVLIVAVVLGQQYYGLVGMLISIPIACALKVVLSEIYAAVYLQYATRDTGR